MFEYFSEPARRVVVHAQDEARALRHDYVGTEHLLLALLREHEGLAADVLASLDMGVDEVREQVVRSVGEGDDVPDGQIPFTPGANNVLELALREAQSTSHDSIGAEHILLGLTQANEGLASRILRDSARREVLRRLSRMPTG